MAASRFQAHLDGPTGRRFLGLTAVGLSCAALLTGCGGTSGVSEAHTPAIAALEKQLAQLEGEADRLNDAHAIKRLQRAYGYYLDQAQWDQMADLFAPDASIEIGLDGVYAGQKRIREYLHKLGGAGNGLKKGQFNEHLELQPVVNVAADGLTAKGRWRAFIMTGQFGESAAWGEGPYENEYVKQNGIWKISKVHWYQTFMVPYAGGWAKNKDLNGGVYVSKQFPPDRPPSEQYGVWPAVYVPPFHYKNPVADPAVSAPADAEPVSTANADDPAAAALRLAITQLRHRIDIARDTDQVENMVSMYGYYLDKQQWDLLTDLFAEDSTMEISQRGVYLGKKGVRRALELFGPQNIEPNHLHNHIQLQPVIHVAPDGQRAWVRSRALSELGTFGQIGVWGDGVYENELVKENGVWKFRHDHVYTTFFTPYDPGWSMGARPTPKASPKIPPDRPPTVVYESFPEVNIPAFHYKNVVTGGETRSWPAVSVEQVPAKLRDTVKRVTRTVTQLEDERAIENLQRSYGFYVDKALWKEAADLFADDGTLEIGGRGVFVGKPRILQYLTWLAPDGLVRGKLFNHLQLQPIVHVAPDGNTALGRWRFLAEVGEDQKSAIWGGGTYENRYVKQDGVWKIQSLHAYFRFYTPYADGWAKTALPNSRPEERLPPDRPPTVVYDSYPSTFIAPFHYPNPVTGK
ncbi:MAG TPA: nuclear transport factor 2 family protein [Steroidobacteraceae bacterium]|nr:nuclear transport factor 2 family protein [Steroidobacteraceae bacterium]